MVVGLHLHSTFGRDVQPPDWFEGRRKLWQRRVFDDVYALCMHQTAVSGGFGPEDFDGLVQRLAGRDEDRSGVPYHYFYSPRHATVIGLWHPTWYAWHGNGANGHSIGLAIDGRFPGDELDGEQLARATQLVLSHAATLGYLLQYVEAHRQHHDQRGGDPGPEVWAVVEKACVEQDVHARPGYTTGSGLALPASWRPTIGTLPPEHGRPNLDLATMPSSEVNGYVKRLQGLLLSHRFGPAGLLGNDGYPDGKPGSRTRQATNDFRVSKGLTAGVVVDQIVWALLDAEN